MKRRFFLSGTFLLLATTVVAEETETIIGTFNTGVSSVEGSGATTLDLRFHRCPDDATRTCATVVNINNPQEGREPILPDGSPIVGFQMIEDLKPIGDNEFRRGRINAIDESMNAGDMKWYGLRVRNNLDGTLTAHGCLGFICPREMTWTAVASPISDPISPLETATDPLTEGPLAETPDSE